MILSTGKQKKNKNTDKAASQEKLMMFSSPLKDISGITLVELMLVAVIILALVTISTPLFKTTYEDLQLSSSARDIANIMQFCQERSVMERRYFRLEIDTGKKSYKILTRDEEREGFKPLASRWGRVFSIPKDIEIEAEEKEVDFFPDGSTTPATVYLANKKGKNYTVSIEHNTGVVKVYDHKKEE